MTILCCQAMRFFSQQTPATSTQLLPSHNFKMSAQPTHLRYTEADTSLLSVLYHAGIWDRAIVTRGALRLVSKESKSLSLQAARWLRLWVHPDCRLARLDLAQQLARAYSKCTGLKHMELSVNFIDCPEGTNAPATFLSTFFSAVDPAALRHVRTLQLANSSSLPLPKSLTEHIIALLPALETLSLSARERGSWATDIPVPLPLEGLDLFFSSCKGLRRVHFDGIRDKDLIFQLLALAPQLVDLRVNVHLDAAELVQLARLCPNLELLGIAGLSAVGATEMDLFNAPRLSKLHAIRRYVVGNEFYEGCEDGCLVQTFHATQVRHYERDILPAPILRYLSSVTCLGDFLLDTEGLDLPTAQQLTARLSSATPTPNSTTPNSSSNLNTEPTRSGVEAAQPQGSGWALCLDGWVYAPSLPAGLAPGCLPHVATLYTYITPDMPEDVGPVVQAALTVAEMRARGQALAAAMPHMRSVQVTLAPGAALGTNTHMALVLALLQGLTSSSAHASSHASSSGDGLTRLSIVFDYGDDLPPGNDDESELSCEECVAAIMALAQAATTTAAGSSAGSDSAGAARGLRSIETANCRMDALDACGRLLACLGSPIQQLRELYDERD